jgi:two-component system, sensor histidine kinase LadS
MIENKFTYLFLLSLLLFFAPIRTKAQYIVDDKVGYLELSPNKARIFEDKSKELVFKDVYKANFEKGKGKSFNFHFDNTSIWIKLEFINPANEDINKVLQVRNPIIDVVGLYYLTSTGDTISEITGDQFDFNSRKKLNRNFQLDISIPANTSKTYYLNLQNCGDLFPAPISISNKETITTANELDQIVLGIYFGFMIFSIFLNIFFYTILKAKSTLYYLGFVIGVMLFNGAITGVTFQYLWPENAYLAAKSPPFLANALLCCSILFFQSFLNFKHYIPKLNKAFNVFIAICFTSAILSLIDIPFLFQVSVLSANVMALILNVMGIPVAISIYRKGFTAARFLIIAFTLLMASALIFVLRNAGVFGYNFITEYGLLIGSGFQVVFLSLAIVDSFQQFKQQALNNLEEVNRLKTTANIELERKVEERTEQLNEEKVIAEEQREIAQQQKKIADEQKEVIEESQKEILDSIHYASRIQRAMLTSEEYITKNLPADFFIFYQPKDIVSGDFYWAVKHQGAFYIATSDCTGHGVPGAFMSLLNISFLNENVIERNILEPAQILTEQRKAIINALNPKGNENSQDGMDCVFTKFDFEKMLITFAGANNGLHIVRDNEMLDFKGNKMPVGLYHEKNEPFTQEEIPMKPGDVVYSFTDGYPDQFGGERGKKFKYKPLYDLLIEIHKLPMVKQKEILQKTINDWMGSQHEQVDDILLIGVLIK